MSSKFIFAYPLLIFLAKSVSAAPLNRTDVSSVINATTSNIVLDVNNKSLFHVMPPSSGSLKIVDLGLGNVNNGYCSSLKSSYSLIKKSLDSRSKLIDPAREKSAEAVAEMEELIDLKRVLTEYYAAHSEYQESFDLVREEKEVDKKKSLIKLEIQNAVNEEHKHYLVEQEDGLWKRWLEIRSDLNKASEDVQKKISVYEAHLFRLRMQKERYRNLYKDQEFFADQVIDRIKYDIEEMERFSKLEGGYVSVVFTSDWDENIRVLREKNPHFRFEKSEVSDFGISFHPLAIEEDSGSLLKYFKLFLGNSGGSDSFVTLTNSDLEAFSEGLSVNLRLSLIGSCALREPDYFGLKKSKDGMPEFGASMKFRYRTTDHRNIKIHYELYEIYQYMISLSTESRIFTSDLKPKISEIMDITGSFKVDWQGLSWNPSSLGVKEKKSVETAIKFSLIDEVLYVASVPLPEFLAPADFTLPVEDDQLLVGHFESACTWSVYCRKGAFKLKDLDEFSFARTVDRILGRGEARTKPALIAFDQYSRSQRDSAPDDSLEDLENSRDLEESEPMGVTSLDEKKVYEVYKRLKNDFGREKLQGANTFVEVGRVLAAQSFQHIGTGLNEKDLNCLSQALFSEKGELQRFDQPAEVGQRMSRHKACVS